MAKSRKKKKTRRQTPRTQTQAHTTTENTSHDSDFQQRLQQLNQLIMQNNLSRAWSVCEALFAERPDDADTLKSMGFMHLAQLRMDTARDLLERANAARPGDRDIRHLLLTVYKDSMQYDKALAMVQENIKHPGNAEEQSLVYMVFVAACDWYSAENLRPEVIRRLIANNKSNVSIDLLLGLNGVTDVDANDMLRLHEMAGRNNLKVSSCLPTSLSQQQLHPATRLKIAYLSPDFRNHAAAYFVYPIIAAHNRQQIEVYCYAYLRYNDNITEKFRTEADHFLDVTEMNLRDLAQRIRRDGIHVVVDLGGHTTLSRLGALAWRPAPVQISYLGYPNTSGMQEVDFHITDRDAEYDGEGGTRYTEELLYMPESFICFGMRPTCPRRDNAPAEDNGYITFGSFNAVRKMNPADIEAWCRILNAVPQSRMAIKGRWESGIVRDNILAEFARHDIGEERIFFLNFTRTYDDHVAQYNVIDITLDTFPYTGTTTTCEALFMGVPVVTLVGKTHAHRVSYSILKSIGFTDTIAHSVDEYVDKAVKLAENPKGLSILRKTIQTLFEHSVVARPDRFTPQLEALYMNACRRKGMDLSKLGSSTVENVQDKTDSSNVPEFTSQVGQSKQVPPANPFDCLPGRSFSRGLMVFEYWSDERAKQAEAFITSAGAPLWLAIVITAGEKQGTIAAALDSIAAEAGQISMIKLKTTTMEPEAINQLISVCSQYITFEGEHGACEKMVHEAALAQRLTVVARGGVSS